mgnify:CR=1 FL=1
MKNYKYDSEIADIVYKIFNAGNFHNETISESILVKLFQLRGTPLNVDTTQYCRDVEKDYKGMLEDSDISRKR